MNKNIKFLISILIGGLALAATALGDDIAVSASETPPDFDIVYKVEPTGDVDFPFSWNNDFEIGQSLLAPDNLDVSSIIISMAKFQPGARSKAFTLNVHEASTNLEPPDEGNIIKSFSGFIPETLTSDGVLIFSPNSPIQLKKDKYYIFMLVSQAPETGIGFPLRQFDSSEGSTFTWHKSETQIYAKYTTRSLTFLLQGKKSAK